ncbi:MAG: prolyl-tRNA synthetase associated domain-containing protein [Granulosicoccus sp.]|nr:prolyl-tRNA synthetase associated domain-containing protein [Granulosicoccus sp.]
MAENSQNCLVDGSAPATPADVQARLTHLGIEFETKEHPPMYTVADSQKFREGVPGGYSKNLFLRNKKGRMWLVTLLEDREVDLRKLGESIGAGRVSFASTTRLMQYLGVIPGSVTPLAVINDIRGQVTAVIDEDLLALSPVHFHPCVNTMTTSMQPSGLLAYMQYCNHDPALISADSFQGAENSD